MKPLIHLPLLGGGGGGMTSEANRASLGVNVNPGKFRDREGFRDAKRRVRFGMCGKTPHAKGTPLLDTPVTGPADPFAHVIAKTLLFCRYVGQE
jgi:hypothetical protein